MNKENWICLLAVLILIGATAAYLSGVKNRQRLGEPGLKMVQAPVLGENDKVIATNTVALPEQTLDYSSIPLPVTDEELKWLPKDTVFARKRYVSGLRSGLPTDVSIVVMGRDRTSIHKPQICLTGQGWRIEKSELLTIPMKRPHPYDLPVMKLTAAKEGRDSGGQVVRGRAVFVYWFVSESQLTAQHQERVWWMVRDLVAKGVLQRWAYVSYLSFCYAGQEAATYERMKEFIGASVPEFQRVSGPKVAGASAPAGLVSNSDDLVADRPAFGFR